MKKQVIVEAGKIQADEDRTNQGVAEPFTTIVRELAVQCFQKEASDEVSNCKFDVVSCTEIQRGMCLPKTCFVSIKLIDSTYNPGRSVIFFRKLVDQKKLLTLSLLLCVV